MQTVKLLDICRPKQWKTLSIKNLNPQGKYFVYGANGIIGKYDSYNHIEETVFITCRGATCGNIHISEKNSYINGNAMCLDELEQAICHRKYLYYYLKSYDMSQVISGSAQPQITIQGLNAVDVVLYDLPKQIKIAKQFDILQETIDIRNNQIEQLDQIIAARFEEMFGKEQAQKHHWDMVALKDIGEGFIGLTYKPEDVSTKGIPVLKSGNIRNNRLDLTDLTRVKKAVKDKIKVQENDILICSRNGSANLIGKAALIKELPEEMTFGAFMTVYRSCYNPYLIHFFHSSYFKKQLHSSSTTTIHQLTKSMLESIVLPMPPEEKRKEFIAFAQQIEKKRKDCVNNLKQMERIKINLMNTYFTKKGN